MNCRNCGGAMELVGARGYFLCRYCGSFYFPEHANDQGVRVLAESAGPVPCPACSKPLSLATLDETHSIHFCGNCRGVLLSRGSFGDVVRLRRAWASGPPLEPDAIRPEELNRRVHCPTCRNPMDTHPYYGPGNVVIDTCDRCNTIWLDFGELKQIVDAPGQDRGGRERSAAAVERWSAPDVSSTPEPHDGKRHASGSVDLTTFLDDLFT